MDRDTLLRGRSSSPERRFRNWFGTWLKKFRMIMPARNRSS
jgi:hypothetical protein